MKTSIVDPKILVIDDEPDIRHLLTMSLVQMGIEVDSAKDVSEAMKHLQNNHYHFCITDMKLPDGNGLSIVEHCHANIPHMPIAVITAFGNTDTAVDAMKMGAFDFLAKPIDLVQLRQLIQNAFNFSVDKNNQTEQHPIDFFNGQGLAISGFRDVLAKVQKSNAPVIIQGAKGTEKEKVAKHVHSKSSRGDYQEEYLDCSTLVSDSDLASAEALLFESKDKESNILFRAHKSSLIVSNIQLLSKAVQRKLLKVLETKTLYLQQCDEEVTVDIRVIICTEVPLEKYVTSLQLREDLYFRLDVLSLKIPPLEQREDDIDIIIDLYSEKYLPNKNLSSKAKNKLAMHNFPYNYRELKNILNKANNLSDSDTIDIKDLSLTQSESIAIATKNNAKKHVSSRGDMSLDEYIAEIEKQEIRSALDLTRWNRTEAAKLLGVSFRTIRYKIKKLEIE